MSRVKGGGRRALREEIESTWHVWDATRPIRKEDMAVAVPPQPEDAQPAPEASPPPHGGTT